MVIATSAVRLPFSLDLALNLDQMPSSGIIDPTLQGLAAVRVVVVVEKS